LTFEINVSNAVPNENVGITLRIEPDFKIYPQGYSLSISSSGILLRAQEGQGIFYGCCTLIQLFQYYMSAVGKEYLHDRALPCLEITDWPDFPHRGVMIDISRDKVPKMETIYSLVDLLSSWKINQLQLYTEHTFAYQHHPEVWENSSPFTSDEILKLDEYCRQRYVELVPNQSSFGHMERWLKHPRYQALAESPGGFEFPWGHSNVPFSLCPQLPESIELISGLYDELLPHFTSRQVNVGCDETFDVGQGCSRDRCKQVGAGRVYFDFLLKIYQEVTKRGFRMQFWGDMIINYPELVVELPKDCIPLEWGYEADHPFAEHGEIFARSGLPFYVCPGTSSWNSIAGRTDNCIQNLRNAAMNGIKYGADGYLITDWGDNGHWQALFVSYLGFATGAAYSWSFSTNQTLDIKETLNQLAFQDVSGKLGTLSYDLGNVYRAIGIEPDNSSAIFSILQQPIQQYLRFNAPDISLQALDHTLEIVEQLAVKLPQTNSIRPDKELIQREFLLTINLLRHSCQRGLFGLHEPRYSKRFLADELVGIIAEFKEIWLKRNRPGGLIDSLAYFDIPMRDYL
jgi:hexosaminidase